MNDEVPPSPRQDADDVVPPPPPLTAAGRLEQLVERLHLEDRFAGLPRVSCAQRDATRQRHDRLVAASTRFLKAVSLFRRGQVFDANGEVRDTRSVARHVIVVAGQLELFRGVRVDASLSRRERMMQIEAEKGVRVERLRPGTSLRLFGRPKAPACEGPGLGPQPIDLLIAEIHSAELLTALEALVDELDLGSLGRGELAQLQDALGKLGIRLGSHSDENQPRTALGRKFDRADRALGLRENRVPGAHVVHLRAVHEADPDEVTLVLGNPWASALE